MKTQAIFLLAMGLSLYSSFAEAKAATSGNCNPNGNQFNLEPLVNAQLTGQSNDSVGFILGRGGNGVDLVVGAASDARVLNPVLFYDGFYLPAYYAQRDNSNCAADFEGGTPVLQGDFPIGAPQVAADPAHDAFFIANTVIQQSDAYAISIMKSTSA